MKKYMFIKLLIVGLAMVISSAGRASADVNTWQRWEQTLTSLKNPFYKNPFVDVTLRVTYTGPGGVTFNGYGFWDGGTTFRIRAMFPVAGTWTWRTTCSDTSDTGLHNKTGAVVVTNYSGSNALYQHGYFRISADKRYLTYADNERFLWIGDTAWKWSDSQGVAEADWRTYLDNRSAKNFTVIQVSARKHDMLLNKTEPYINSDIKQINPVYWQGFDQRIQDANYRGLAVHVVGLSLPLIYAGSDEVTPEADDKRAARYLVARMMGNFVIFSPGFDDEEEMGPAWNKVNAVARNTVIGDEIQGATSLHLVSNHPNPDEIAGAGFTENNFYSEKYYDKTFMDFAGLQSGRGKPDCPNSAYAAQGAIERNLALYNRASSSSPKPVVNMETRYDSPYTQSQTQVPRLPRSIGYWSFLSGAKGYTYGVSGVLLWATATTPIDSRCDGGVRWTWDVGMEKPSSYEMQYLSQFLSSIAWERLLPDQSVIKNQPSDWTKKMAFARTPERDLAVAYLPDNAQIQLDLSSFQPMSGRWFNPRDGLYSDLAQTLSPTIVTIPRPATSEDWVLILTPANY